MTESSNPILTAAYLLLFGLWGASNYVPVPVPFNLIATSTAIVFIGSYRSLNLLVHESEGGPSKEDKEVLSAADAYKFPFVGSAALFGLYVAFKYFDKDTVNLVLSVYFAVAGVLTLTSSLSKFVSQFITSKSQFGFKKTFPLIGEVNCLLTPADIFSLLISIVFCGVYLKTKHFLMNNIFGISFCIQSIERISLGSYQIGAILLVGLFFYDIFWVFGTDVMVTVAKSFDAPIKLLFPRAVPPADGKGEFNLLGLGDIVIPGLFVALLLRFDAMRTAKKNNVVKITKDIENQPFNKPYFFVNIVAYAAGLLTTVLVMIFFEAAQPALLYLVPGCLGGSLFTAIARNEFSLMWSYNEEEKKEGEAVEAKKEK